MHSCRNYIMLCLFKGCKRFLFYNLKVRWKQKKSLWLMPSYLKLRLSELHSPKKFDCCFGSPFGLVSYPFEHFWSKRISDLNVDKSSEYFFFLMSVSCFFNMFVCRKDSSCVVHPRTLTRMHRTMHNLCGHRQTCQ